VLPPSLSRSVTSMPPERRTTAVASGEADGSFSGYEPSFSPPCSELSSSSSSGFGSEGRGGG
jgi:hypothetical protein